MIGVLYRKKSSHWGEYQFLSRLKSQVSLARYYEADGGPDIEDIFKLLKGSLQASQDCQLFFAMQVFSWFIEAPDGHAKNYSIFLKENGLYCLTPFYDLLSASPLIANGSLQANKVKLAMGISGKNKHYKIADTGRKIWDGS